MDESATPESDLAGSGFFDEMRVIEQRLSAREAVDLNELSPMGKEAARAIVDEARARIVKSEGRYVVVSKRPNRLLEFFSAGTAA